MRTAEITRKTNETDIRLSLDLDGQGKSRVRTGVGFLDHMLTLLARHGGMDLELTCDGDTQVDDHHSVEDIGIALGMAFRSALGDRRGIRRYADVLLPMDEAGEEATGDVYLYRYREVDGEPTLENIDDDEEYEIAADAFDEWMDEQEFEELPDME